MGCIITLLLIINIVFVIAIDVICWIVEWQKGLAGVFGVIGFLTAYAISVEMSIAPREFWTNSEFDIFKKKLGYAWGTMIIVWCIAYTLIIYFFQ